MSARWLALMEAARGGDAAAREELVQHFTPFVHGVLASRLPLRLANARVQPLLEQALQAFDGGLQARVLEAARRSVGPAEDDAVGRLRAVGSEALVLRLLEGITGPEIAEFTGASPDAVRAELERAMASLVSTGEFAADAYLWSLAGTPHPAVVRLENELGALRYDPAAPAAGAALVDDTTGRGAALAVEEVKTAPRAQPLDDRTAPAGQALGAPAQANPFSELPGTQRAAELPVAAKQVAIIAPVIAPAPLSQPVSKPGLPEPVPMIDPGTIQHYDVVGAVPSEPPAAAPVTAATRDERTPEVTPVIEATKQQEAEATVPRGAPLDDSTVPRGVQISILAESWKPPATPVRVEEPTGTGPALPRLLQPRPEQRSWVWRGATPFAAAAVLLTLCGIAVWTVVRASQRDVRRGWALVPVVVASRSIPEGTTVTMDMISVREVPEQFATSSVVKPEAVAYITNQRIMVPVQAGDPLLWAEFQTAFSNERLSTRVRKQGRAYTLEAEEITAVGGWVRPGDHVDVIVTTGDGDHPDPLATTTLQDLVVLATGKITPKTNTAALKPRELEYANVSVMALPEEIEILALTRASATYTLVLRSDDDHERVETKPVRSAALVDPQRRVSRAARPAPPKSPITLPAHWAPWVDLHPEKPGINQ